MRRVLESVMEPVLGFPCCGLFSKICREMVMVDLITSWGHLGTCGVSWASSGRPWGHRGSGCLVGIFF